MSVFTLLYLITFQSICAQRKVKENAEQKLVKLNGDFKICSPKGKQIVSKNIDCVIDADTQPEGSGKWHILIKRKNMIDGKMLYFDIKKRTRKTTLGGGSTNTMDEITSVFERDFYINNQTGFFNDWSEYCYNMFKEKKCVGNRNMTCIKTSENSEECTYHNKLVIGRKVNFFLELLATIFKWNENVDYDCKFVEKPIMARNINDVLAIDIDGKNCHLDKNMCLLNDGLMLWNPENIGKKCEYMYYRTGNFEEMTNKLWTNTTLYKRNKPVNDVTKSDTTNILFQLKPKIYACDMEIHPTAQGFYVTKSDKALKENEEKSDYVSSDLITKMRMTNRDFQIHQNDIFKKEKLKKILELSCNQIVTQMYEAVSDNDTFADIYDMHQNPKTVYYLNTNIYVPKCANVTNVRVVLETSSCYRDIPVLFTNIKTNKSLTGFLTVNGFLRRDSELVMCDGRVTELNLRDKYYIKRVNGTTKVSMIKSDDVYHYRPLAYRYGNIDFTHSDILQSSFQLKSEADSRKITIDEGFKSTWTMKSNKKMKEIYETVKEPFSKYIAKGAIQLTIALIVLFVISVCVYMLYKKITQAYM